MNRKEEIEIETGRFVSILSMVLMEKMNLFVQIMGAEKQEIENIAENMDVLENIAESLKQSFIQVTKNLLKLKKEYFELEDGDNEIKNNDSNPL